VPDETVSAALQQYWWKSPSDENMVFKKVGFQVFKNLKTSKVYKFSVFYYWCNLQYKSNFNHNY